MRWLTAIEQNLINDKAFIESSEKGYSHGVNERVHVTLIITCHQ